ncbi:uncharacterized protein [Branchiostoma lanceolatum]|uniref:uncharacterized protein isoform X2 n=1 Tax=Branchiostoma lanceolatum TaxID=7740 RepID=UPI003452C6F2
MTIKLLLTAGLVFLVGRTAATEVFTDDTLSPALVPQQTRNSIGDEANEVEHLVETLKNLIEEEDRAAEPEGGASEDGLDADPPVEVMEELEKEEEREIDDPIDDLNEEEEEREMPEEFGGETSMGGVTEELEEVRHVVSGLRRLVRVCEHQTLTIRCPAGRQINIVSALYGRTSRGYCSNGPIRTTSCRSSNSLARVRTSCQGKSSCSVRASNSVFGDPCVGTFKYLEVRYACTGRGSPGYTSLGCWRDTGNRAIPTLEGTDPRLDGSYGARQNPIEKCYQVALSRGFAVFAVQHGGWCAGSTDGHNTYNKYGPSTACRADGEGGPWANAVYQITGRPTGCRGWTRWYDRDNPSATGDWENLSNLRQENPGQICAAPSGIQARVKGANTPASQTGRQFSHFNPQAGFVCQNNDQSGSDRCLDYEVRFWCP